MNTISPKPLSSSLARRLAEAADGFRNVSQVYFIAGYAFPHPIKDFPDLNAAQYYFTDKGLTDADYAIFGPYKTMDETETFNLVGAEKITMIDLTIHFNNNIPPQTVQLTGNIDSIFLNLSSLEKFVFPYYCRLYGVEYVRKMRENLLAKYKNQLKDQEQTMALKPPPPQPHSTVTIMYNLIDGEELPA